MHIANTPSYHFAELLVDTRPNKDRIFIIKEQLR